VHVVRPFHRGSSQEIVKAPKVYGFDTGFVCYFRGWDSLRPDDYGPLWEHLVLNEVFGALQTRTIRYWRDKSRREVDFVLPVRRGHAVTVEAKWSADAFDVRSLRAFRERYPDGPNLVVAHDVAPAYARDYQGLLVRFVSLSELAEALRSAGLKA
jgi:predicted AAA+ superfamily ATPase